MLDYLWSAMLILGVVWGLWQGKAAELTQAVLDGGKNAVELSMTMLGVMAVWTGLLEVGKSAGLLAQVNRLLGPVIAWLFPGLPKDHPATESISTNFAANLLGLGNAATPAALKAMKELQELEEERGNGKTAGALWQKRRAENELRQYGKLDAEKRQFRKSDTANNEMCTFLIINISSLQLVPINMIAYRSQYGSVNPAAITVPVLIATLCSTLVGILFCKLAARNRRP
ncbi:MAG: nucleoside recognition protein [Lachnospiraceae bacterium]|nr:nucleoside recognition protein [Lachnospiraceae bacterium]